MHGCNLHVHTREPSYNASGGDAQRSRLSRAVSLSRSLSLRCQEEAARHAGGGYTATRTAAFTDDAALWRQWPLAPRENARSGVSRPPRAAPPRRRQSVRSERAAVCRVECSADCMKVKSLSRKLDYSSTHARDVTHTPEYTCHIGPMIGLGARHSLGIHAVTHSCVACPPLRAHWNTVSRGARATAARAPRRRECRCARRRIRPPACRLLLAERDGPTGRRLRTRRQATHKPNLVI